MEFITIVTDTGILKLAEAQANNLPLNLTHLAVGDSGGEYYEPSKAQTALINENWRGTINRIYQDEEYPDRLVIEVAISNETGGFYIREAGIFDADGDLFAVANIPETYKPDLSEGSTRDLYIKLVLQISSIDNIELILDPSVVIATREYVDSNHNNDPNAHQNRWVKKSGDIMTGNLSLPDAIESQHAVNLGQLESGLEQKSDKTHTHLDIIPAGAVLHFAMITPPSGWLFCNGSAVSRSQYLKLFEAIGTIFGTGDGSTTFNLPDLRGEFIRGWDNNRGIDAARAFGTLQEDEFKSHNHSSLANGSANHGGHDVGFWVNSANYGLTTTGLTGGAETRPRNIALLPCIKY